MNEYLTVKEASDFLGVSAETLRRWDNSGRFVSKRHPMNNYRVYAREELESLASTLTNPNVATIKIDSPFFQTELGELYNVDAILFLKSLEPQSVDLIFADPPYNIKKAQWDSFKSQREYVEWSMTWIKEAARVLRPTGSLYICGFSEILADVKWAASHLFEGCKWLVWFYRNKANLSNDWGRSHESILHFRKSKKFTFNVDEVRIPYNDHTLKYPKRAQGESSQYSNGKKHEWEPNPLGAKPKDVLEIPTLSNGTWERHSHETQKPVELLSRIIRSSSNPGDLVIDPFGGSGTTYAVAEAFDRKWKGSELESTYCELIQERLSDFRHLNRIKDGTDARKAASRRRSLRNAE
ncbi:DNA methyltransferase [Phaeocystidibacter marisrubri]|uniref:Methyltransferase n=1 Tax=Phaeocystidibacter marisrubri TaxID=1577780 RepID=A0A6L3ZF66_9FLAO|nr:DNA methyltransferase [Phaeocystidibacter marisrubri]KAB2816104.1 MerR family DNA-binding transcriptional regulator [Phaeocystidibacter marisrubri]GGH67346.1 hypothetical protein GCM10011318_06230 [Phaeocystidibacter marisrubri]